MTRNSFMKLFLAVSTFTTAPFSVLAIPFNKKRIDNGLKVDAGKDRFDESFSLFEGDSFFCKVSAKDTDGDIYIFESIRDKKGGPPFTIILSRMNGGIF